jgi:hypothetical protein
MSYTITDDQGVERFETISELSDGLIMRGVSLAEAALMICNLVQADLDSQEAS